VNKYITKLLQFFVTLICWSFWVTKMIFDLRRLMSMYISVIRIQRTAIELSAEIRKHHRITSIINCSYLSIAQIWLVVTDVSGLLGCPETSVTNYQSTTRDIPEERRKLEFTLLRLKRYSWTCAEEATDYRPLSLHWDLAFIIFFSICSSAL
jgi:hypothetical protein